MSVSTKLGDEFLRIPKLDVSSTNWVIFKDRFTWALDARGILDHIDGTGTEPVDPIPEEARKKEPLTLTEEQGKLDVEWRKGVKEWRQAEAIAKQQIASSIPDSLFMKVRAKGTAYEIWTELGKHFEKRSRMVSIDLRRRLQELRCADKGDITEHFATMRTMREDLASMGETLTENDFYAIIMGSLPSSYDPYLSALNATSSVLGTHLSPDDLMLSIIEEYERRALKSKGKQKDENAAFYSNDAEKGQKGSSNPKRNGDCHNCGKKGHWTRDCYAEGGGKEGQGPKQKSKKGKWRGKKETAATAKVKDGDKDKGEKPKEEEAWMAMVMDDEWALNHLEEASNDDFVDLDADSNNMRVFSHMNEENGRTDDIPDHFLDLPDLFDSIDDPLDVPDDVTDIDQQLNAESESTVWTNLEAAYLVGTEETRTTEVDLYDSGMSRHMSGFHHRMFNYMDIEPVPIVTADKRSFRASGKGDMYIYLPNRDKSNSRILLKDVLYAPKMGITLVSISRIAGAGSTVVFTGNVCRIYTKDREVIGEIKVKSGLYRVYTSGSKASAYAAETAPDTLSVDELHRLLGHVSHDRAKHLVTKGLVEGVMLEAGSEAVVCESCEWAKGTRKQMSKVREDERRTAVGDEIHSDLWGKAPVESINRKLYYVTFTDDYSRYTNVYFLHSKDETFDSYKAYEAWLSNQYGVRIKCLCSDRGGEFMSDEFTAHLKSKGSVRKLVVHDTPEHNGVAERLNRTLLDKVRAMLHDSGLPKFLWAKATAHAVYLKNRTWTRTIGETTPYELLNGRKPNIGNLHPWGCKVRVHDTSGSKLDGHSSIGRWMGFDAETKDGHRVYWPGKRTISVERNVRFNVEPEEVVVGVLPLEGENTADDEGERLTANEPERHNVDNETSDAEIPAAVPKATEGRGKRIRKETEYVRMLKEGLGETGSKGQTLPRGMRPGTTPSSKDGESVKHASAVDLESEINHAMAAVIENVEGLTPSYEEAQKRPDWPKWKEAIKKELNSLEKMGTWRLVKRPPDTNIVDSKWVLRIKKNSAGEIDKYKARLVAKGFTQIYGVDYYESYAPVARLTSFRLLLAIAARNGWAVDNFDFDSAYLNSKLADEEVVYVEQPPGYEAKDRKSWVLQLLKSLYGLKQAAKNWYDHLYRALLELGFMRTEVDHGVFFKEVGNHIIIFAVHVDDGMVTGSSVPLINKFKEEMNAKYTLTDLGAVNWLLVIKITRDLVNRTISLSQHAYIDAIITKFNFDDLKPLSIPMDPSAPLSKSQSPSKLEDIAKMKNVPYREAVGSLMYAAMGTRPDIAFATSMVAQFSDNPGWAHWEAVKRIYRYLKGTRDLVLTYGGEKRGLLGYVDADGASQEHHRAISGYVFMVDGGAVSWSSKKQELVTLSTTEAEYVAQTHAAKEAIWIRRLLTELFNSVDTPTILFSDSKSAIALAQDGHYHARTKHIDIRYHFIRYIIEAGTIKLVYCPTNEMTADTLTEALPSVKAKHFATALGLTTV
jgi:Reverse transcriptase (RNA-dependent DNA polymerase)/gag-polypeptide of LTR copia-type